MQPDFCSRRLVLNRGLIFVTFASESEKNVFARTFNRLLRAFSCSAQLADEAVPRSQQNVDRGTLHIISAGGSVNNIRIVWRCRKFARA